MKYAEQYDLPIYPDTQPKDTRRTICGIEPSMEGVQVRVGGGVVGTAKDLEKGRKQLHHYLTASLEGRIAEAEAQAAYYRTQLDQLNEQDSGGLWVFRVRPEK